jgi:hypothetical protein
MDARFGGRPNEVVMKLRAYLQQVHFGYNDVVWELRGIKS